MLEKAIVALQLLGHLAETGLPIRRLSIDVDIVTQATPAQLISALEAVAKLAPFTAYEHDAERDRELPPKKHFRVFYPSAIEPKTDHILLDVLFERDEAPNCEPVLIATPFITPERDVRVPVPTVNSLLGDKLTAFAPRTIGILFHPHRKCEASRIRTLFFRPRISSLCSAGSAAGYAGEFFLRKCRNRRSWHVINVKLRGFRCEKTKIETNYEIRTTCLPATGTVRTPG